MNYFDLHKEIESIPIYEHTIVSEQYTIAIPTYKRPNLLKYTLEAACSQDNFYNYNIIVVDNNPERFDETEVLMESYRTNFKVSYYKNSANLGMAGNWNRLFVLSQTKYVIMLHDDDLIHPTFMVSLNEVLTKYKKHITVLKPKEIRWKDDGTTFVFQPQSENILAKRILDFQNYKGFIIGAPTGCLFDKLDILKLGGFNTNYSQTAADVDLIVRLGSKYPVYQVPLYLMMYRISVNASFDVETQYLSVVRCYSIMKSLLMRYYIPKWFIDYYWAYYLKGWTEYIKESFCEDFTYNEALRRINMCHKSLSIGRLCYIILRIYEHMLLLFK